MTKEKGVLPVDSQTQFLKDIMAKKLKVPEYQRGYSWEKEHVIRLFQNIIDKFSNYIDNKQKEMVPLYLGNIMIKKSRNNNEQFYEIIDGQQRLTTLMMLVKLINEKSGKDFSNIKLELLENDQNQINDLKIVVEKFDLETTNKKYKKIFENTYHKIQVNYIYLNELINDCLKNLDLSDEVFFEELYNFIKEYIYFIVVNVNEDLPLSEVVKIFNELNTAGMNLLNGDVFKITYYSFLCNNSSDTTDILTEIDKNYEKINQLNNEIISYNTQKEKNIINDIIEKISMNDVLTLYKHIIAYGCNMTKTDSQKGNEEFFEMCFKLVEKDKSSKVVKLLDLNIFSKLVDIFCECCSNFLLPNNEENGEVNLYIKLFRYTRYNRFWTLPYFVAFYDWYHKFDSSCENCGVDNYEINYKSILDIMKKAFAIMYVNTIRYFKIVESVKDEIIEIYRGIAIEDNMAIEDNKTSSIESDIEAIMTLPIYGKSWRKYFLPCLIVSIQYEIEEKNENFSYLECLSLFLSKNQSLNCDHIIPREYFKSINDNEIYNTIGNLILLEENLNKSAQDKPLVKKRDKYQQSKFRQVREFCKVHDSTNWGNKKDIEIRRNSMNKKILSFLKR